MFKKRKSFNPKRVIDDSVNPDKLDELQGKVRYGGNPEHKRNPGDYGLTPPSSPRADKMLCDGVSIFKRRKALSLLKKGIAQGAISVQIRNGFPQNIWSMTEDGIPLEAQLENSLKGTYHGYPVSPNDPFRFKIINKLKGDSSVQHPQKKQPANRKSSSV